MPDDANTTDPDRDDTGQAAPEDGQTAPSRAPEGSGEAAKYRRRLRDTEAERDQLASQLQAVQRREAERLAAQGLADGTDLWRGGVDLAQLLDDDGAVSDQRVAETVAELLAQHPHWGPRAPTADPDQGRKSQGQLAPSFAEFLSDAHG